MKVALCISGQLRDIKKNSQNYLDKLIIPNNIEDIFIHSWFDENDVNKEFIINYYQGPKPILEVDSREFMLSTYTPKKYIFEKESIIRENNYTEDSYFKRKHMTSGHNFQCMTYSIWKCNELKKKYENEFNFKYDAVVRTRTDLIFNDIINTNELDLKYINIPTMNTSDTWANDMFAIGNSLDIDIYSEIWKRYKEYYDSGIIMHAEEIFFEHFKVNKLKYKTNFENKISFR